MICVLLCFFVQLDKLAETKKGQNRPKETSIHQTGDKIENTRFESWRNRDEKLLGSTPNPARRRKASKTEEGIFDHSPFFAGE